MLGSADKLWGGTEGAHSEEGTSQAVTQTPKQEGIGEIILP